MENYSLSDIAAATGEGLGGNNIVTLLLLFALMGGNGLWGGNKSAATDEILSGQKFDALSRQINQVGDGLASSTFALNNSIKDGNASVSSAIVNEGRSIQTQLCGINANIDSKFAALEKTQLEQTIAAQQNQINQLYMAQQMCGIVRYPNALTYNAGTSPFCNCNC